MNIRLYSMKFWFITCGMLLIALIFGVVLYLYQKLPVVEEVVQIERGVEEQVVIDQWYAPLHRMMVSDVYVMASVADTLATRVKGLSGTPYLPLDVVKLFVFEESDTWSFWMKGMKYAIDIIWIDENGVIVHIEEAVSPKTYPKSFMPSTPVLYVVEAVAGFVKTNNIEVGMNVTLPATVSENYSNSTPVIR